MIEFDCPKCNTIICVADSKAGCSYRCRQCGYVDAVPSAEQVRAALPVAAPVAYARPGPAESAGLAIAALVLGLCGFIPIVGALTALGAVALGIASLTRKRPGKGMAIAGVVTGVVSLLTHVVVIISVVTMVGQMRAWMPRAMAQARLNAIGMAIQSYSNLNGQAPPNLQALVSSGDLAAGQLAGGPGFVYVPATPSAPPGAIVACERIAAAGDTRLRHVLFADGSVTWMNDEDFQAALKRPENAAFAKALAQAQGR